MNLKFSFKKLCLGEQNHKAALILLIIIGILTHHQWFTNLSLFVHGDFVIDESSRISEFFRLPQSWSDNSLGYRDVGIVFWPLYLISGLLAKIGFSRELLERVLFLWPVAICTPVFMYQYAYSLFKNKYAAFTSAIVYSYNIPLIVLSTGILTAHIAISFAPLLFLFYTNLLKKPNYKDLFYSAFVIFLIGSFDFRFLYLVALILAPYTLLLLSIYRIRLLVTFFYIVTLGVLVVALNLYWIPSIFVASFGSEIFSRGLWGGSFVDLMRPFFLFLYIWTGDEMAPFVNQRISLLTLPIPILAFFGLYFNRKNSTVVYFALISVVGIFLTKLNNPPFQDVYEWLYYHFPGFGAFRESSKFYFYIFFGYSILIGGLISYLTNYIENTSILKKIYLLLSLIFINALFIFNTIPLINGSIKTLYSPRSIPSDYKTLNKFIHSQDDFFRYMFIPRDSKWGGVSGLHPKIGLTELITKSPISGDFHLDYVTFDGETFYSAIQNDRFTQYLRAASIKYLVIPIRDIANDDDFYIYYGNNKNRFENILFNIPGIKRLNNNFGDLIVYEVENYNGLVTIENSKGIQSRLASECPTSTKCNFSLPSHIEQPFFIDFSNRFDPGWRVYLNANDGLLYPPPENQLRTLKHEINEFGFNRFYFDEIAVNNLKDNQSLTIYYQPQKNIVNGTLITIITFSLMVFILLLSKISSNIKSRKNP